MLANLLGFLLHPELAVLIPHVGPGRVLDGTLLAEGIAVVLATSIGFTIPPVLKGALRPGAARLPDRPASLEAPATEASRTAVRIR